ncbi:MAG: MazG-like family protein [Thermaerobacter sp.]|nr:MazG-like family protein [Thermaerobacter sp.]MDA8144637.1 MazG-like family protein [Thermaerobacter sp.]
MPPEQEIDVAGRLAGVEWLKTELLSGVSSVFRALQREREEEVLDALAAVIIADYVLGRRLGIHFVRLDLRVRARLSALIEGGHAVEEEGGDLSALARFWEGRRGTAGEGGDGG